MVSFKVGSPGPLESSGPFGSSEPFGDYYVQIGPAARPRHQNPRLTPPTILHLHASQERPTDYRNSAQYRPIPQHKAQQHLSKPKRELRPPRLSGELLHPRKRC
ncbi:hypothetical protein OJ253_1436 [Cryptosporidium canis]|uniref:Uncharacterized protein n=1 Tax=Cryptosporidium canis TaxID=195482 RepID=A0A9D5DGX7_9CRYT|nr:hypothetical protein OJ253_1436 [Cryptosporidium canis]